MENKDRISELFSAAKNQPTQTSFEETKKRFLETTSKQNTTSKKLKNAKLFNLKNLAIMLSIFSVASISIWLLFAEEAEPIIEKKAIKAESSQTEQVIVGFDKESISKMEKIPIEVISMDHEKINTIKSEHPNYSYYIPIKTPVKQVKQKLSGEEDSLYRFPTLTPEEKEFVKKTKKEMLKALSKMDKDEYAYIPSGTFEWNNNNVSVLAFYMKTKEVTVLEYRTFLFDLLMQNRKDDFLKAKPNQEMWVKLFSMNLKPMQDHYFSHEAYNSYPINNISREGAEMYCKWLTEEYFKSDFKKKKTINDVRIPSEIEWIYAASAGGEQFPYPWGGPYNRNAKGCYLANFKPGKSNTESCLQITHDRPDIKNRSKNDLTNFVKTLDDAYINKDSQNEYYADGGLYTVKVNSYIPNEFGLYCMSGNVAEMVYYNNSRNLPGTKGGSWMSPSQEIQINGEDPYKGKIDAHPAIGFRVVISYSEPDKKKEAFRPPGGVLIKENVYIDETEITNFSWMEYIYWTKRTYGDSSEQVKKIYPDTMVWSNGEKYREPFTEHYLSHPSFRDYPIVGVSYEQVVEFCSWRTERVKEWLEKVKEANSNKYYPKNFVYRLPTREEWEIQAKSSFNGTFEKEDKKHEGMSKYNYKRELDTTKAFVPDHNVNITAPAFSYWPNDYGVYNVIGNVAEMIDEKGIAKGGSWKHTKDEIGVYRDYSYTKPEDWLGFRCVFEILEE